MNRYAIFVVIMFKNKKKLQNIDLTYTEKTMTSGFEVSKCFLWNFRVLWTSSVNFGDSTSFCWQQNINGKLSQTQPQWPDLYFNAYLIFHKGCKTFYFLGLISYLPILKFQIVSNKRYTYIASKKSSHPSNLWAWPSFKLLPTVGDKDILFICINFFHLK